MKIVSFFSFKGGVGRTALMTNLGALLASRGQVVLLIDMDFFAPGLSFSPLAGPPLDPAGGGGGMSDLLATFLAGDWRDNAIDFVRPSSLLRDLELPSSYLENTRGRLLLIDAGRRTNQLPTHPWFSSQEEEGPSEIVRPIPAKEPQGDESRDESVLRFLAKEIRRDLEDWRFTDSNGAERGIDHVLIDCRTGHAELQDLSLGYLADQMVVISGLNEQNLHGLELTLDALKKRGRVPLDMFAGLLTVVFSPVPAGEDDAVFNALERGMDVIYRARRVTRSGLLELTPPVAPIYYTPLLATSDEIVTLTRPRSLYSKAVRHISDLIFGVTGKGQVSEDELIKEVRSKAIRLVPNEPAQAPPVEETSLPALKPGVNTDLPGWSWPLGDQANAAARLEELIPPNPGVTADRSAFATMTCHSVSLTLEEKKRTLGAFPKLSQFQFDELLNIFEEEQRKFVRLQYDQARFRSQMLAIYYKHQKDWAGLVLGDNDAGIKRFLLAPTSGETLFAGWEEMALYWTSLAHDLIDDLNDLDAAKLALGRAQNLADDADVANRFLESWGPDNDGRVFPESVEDLAQEMAPNAPTVRFHVARNRLRRSSGGDGPSRSMLEELLAEPPEDGPLCDAMARYVRAEMWSLAEQSEQAAQKATELLPRNPGVWNGWGNVLTNHLGRHEEAEQAYRKSMELDGKSSDPWNGLGNVLTNHLGRHEEAEQAYRKSMELDGKSPYPWNGLGKVLADHLGRYEEAERAYRKAIDLDGKYSYSWSGLGSLLDDHLGRYEEAEQAFRKAIALEPSAAHWNGLGVFLKKRFWRYTEAEQAFREAIEKNPDDAYPVMNLGHLLVARGRRKRGLKHLESAFGMFSGGLKSSEHAVTNTIRLGFELGKDFASELVRDRFEERRESRPKDFYLLITKVMLDRAGDQATDEGRIWTDVLGAVRSHDEAFDLLVFCYYVAVVNPAQWALFASLADGILHLPEQQVATFKDVPMAPEILDRYRPFADGTITEPGDSDDPLFEPYDD